MIYRLLVITAVAFSACSRPLPEAGSVDARLYAERCGSCHVVYAPRLLTAAMWETMVDRMEVEMHRRGRRLEDEDKRQILAYLRRNAGSR